MSWKKCFLNLVIGHGLVMLSISSFAQGPVGHEECDAAGLTGKIKIEASDIEILKIGDKINYKKNGSMKVAHYTAQDVECQSLGENKYMVTGYIVVKLKDQEDKTCIHYYTYQLDAPYEKAIWFVNHGTSEECVEHKESQTDGHSHTQNGNFHGGQAHGNGIP